MDLVTDFQKMINTNTKKSISFLQKIYISVDQEKKYDLYRDVNKYYTAMSIWVKNLIEYDDSENNILLNNILLDYCSIINCIVLNDKKLIFFEIRNIIESFIRIVTKNYTTRDLEKLFRDINAIESIECKKNQMQIHISRLKQSYDEACLHIHTDTTRIPMSLTNLIDYNLNDISINEAMTTFNKVNLAMLNILKIKYIETYMSLKDNAKTYMDELLKLEDRIAFKKIIEEHRHLS